MTDLPSGALSQFPVRFLRHQVANGMLPPATTHSQRVFARSINFANSFDQGRNHGNNSHNAIDVFGPIGLRIVATTDGQVVENWRAGGETTPRAGVTTSGGGGNSVMMLDSEGYHHYYAHMSHAPMVRPGQAIRAGDQLGFLGDTGKARGTPAHLHYQVSIRPERGRAQMFNPYQELRRLVASLDPEIRGTRILIHPSNAGPSVV